MSVDHVDHGRSFSSRPSPLLLRSDLSDPALQQNALHIINILNLLRIHFCCKASKSEKSAGLRSELLGGKFHSSIISGTWSHVNGELLLLA